MRWSRTPRRGACASTSRAPPTVITCCTATRPSATGPAPCAPSTKLAGSLRVRSANPLFMRLLAQAIDDLRLDSVDSDQRRSLSAGPRHCLRLFPDRQKWTYVWTRDLSYSADLALAFVDPARTVRSLRFKTSPMREGIKVPDGLPADGWQIIQDTGSGGSWPVSSDRVAWALGARAALDQLTGAARADFARAAYRVLRGSLEADHAAAFDAGDGLYRGEQSFLDWRDQTYAPYVLQDLTELAQSKALSTNVLHYSALQLAASLARQWGTAAEARRYGQWAQALKAAINEHFWLPDAGLYASLTTPDAVATPVARFDLLGEALAITSGVADEHRAAEVLANYPHAPFGAPVYYPQQPDTVVYHNRAIWPFVSAYALEAAVRVGNTAVADQAVDTLMRAAALHLTNPENLEWLTGRSRFDDGPVINSPRQLWSVAAYIAMVAKTVFGYHADASGLRIEPFLSTHLRQVLGGDTATLENIAYQGRLVAIVLRLPPAGDPDGIFPVAAVRLNGRALTGPIQRAQLRAGPAQANRIDVAFGPPRAGDGRLRGVAAVSPLSHDAPAVFAPAVPRLQLRMDAMRAQLQIVPDAAAPAPLRYAIWRDGMLVRPDGAEESWTDPADPRPLGAALLPRRSALGRQCQRLASVGSGVCRRQRRADTVETARAVDGSVSGGADYVLDGVAIAAAGTYDLALRYDNHLFDINTGITNAVKRLEVLDARQRVVASAIVQMPHVLPQGAAHPDRLSTPLRARLAAGRYRDSPARLFQHELPGGQRKLCPRRRHQRRALRGRHQGIADHPHPLMRALTRATGKEASFGSDRERAAPDAAFVGVAGGGRLRAGRPRAGAGAVVAARRHL